MSLDEIAEGLWNALELERELGIRTVEIDRRLLAGPSAVSEPSRLASPVSRPETRDEDARRETRDATAREDARRETRDATAREDARREGAGLPLVFLHDRALSPGGTTMMAKAIAAMHLTPETAPILFTGTRPAARVTVVLGSKALKHWFPGQRAAPGQWISPDGERNVLVTYSPDHILRFGSGTAAVRELKVSLWTSLKEAVQRM